MPELNKHYSVPEGKEDYSRRAMFKTMIWRKNKNAIELGFNIDMNGDALVPDHETLRHFEKNSIR